MRRLRAAAADADAATASMVGEAAATSVLPGIMIIVEYRILCKLNEN